MHPVVGSDCLWKSFGSSAAGARAKAGWVVQQLRHRSSSAKVFGGFESVPTLSAHWREVAVSRVWRASPPTGRSHSLAMSFKPTGVRWFISASRSARRAPLAGRLGIRVRLPNKQPAVPACRRERCCLMSIPRPCGRRRNLACRLLLKSLVDRDQYNLERSNAARMQARGRAVTLWMNIGNLISINPGESLYCTWMYGLGLDTGPQYVSASFFPGYENWGTMTTVSTSATSFGDEQGNLRVSYSAAIRNAGDRWVLVRFNLGNFATPGLVASGASVTGELGGRKVPLTVIVDAKGVVVATQVGHEPAPHEESGIKFGVVPGEGQVAHEIVFDVAPITSSNQIRKLHEDLGHYLRNSVGESL